MAAMVVLLLLLESLRGGQWPYSTASDAELGIPPDAAAWNKRVLAADIPGRRVPVVTAFSNLWAPDLSTHAVPLPEANTLVHVNFQQRRFGRLPGPNNAITFFNPETILVKFRSQPLVSALRVEPTRECDAVQTLRQRPDVEFAELDTFERRQFTPNDPMLSQQWHHDVIESFEAWNTSLGSQSVAVAIVDTPFQMDHPDLAANTVAGWDVDANQPVTNAEGIFHSTMCAGMAAAVINNNIGVAGAANCRILPISIIGSLSDMYNATIWAAGHGVRVVSISWSGGTNDTLEAAGAFLKTNAAGLLIMSALDGTGQITGPGQPDVYCVSMTDAADNFQGTISGPYIDFAAPGYDIYSTTIAGGYTSGTGCSFAAPLVAGVVAWIFGLNPTLSPDHVIGILTNTSVQLGSPLYYGWGRIDFGAAASAALATLPNITSVQWSNGSVAIAANYRAGVTCTLWRSAQFSPAQWNQVANAILATNAAEIVLTDPSPPPATAFYRVQASSFGH